jgi:hypothetical protein
MNVDTLLLSGGWWSKDVVKQMKLDFRMSSPSISSLVRGVSE